MLLPCLVALAQLLFLSPSSDGQTCAEKQRETADIDCQFCPGCNVATVKTEGCNSMICVCGTYW